MLNIHMSVYEIVHIWGVLIVPKTEWNLMESSFFRVYIHISTVAIDTTYMVSILELLWAHNYFSQSVF